MANGRASDMTSWWSGQLATLEEPGHGGFAHAVESVSLFCGLGLPMRAGTAKRSTTSPHAGASRTSPSTGRTSCASGWAGFRVLRMTWGASPRGCTGQPTLACCNSTPSTRLQLWTAATSGWRRSRVLSDGSNPRLTVSKRQQTDINLLALFCSNEGQSTGLVALSFGGIKGKTGEQTGERNHFSESKT